MDDGLVVIELAVLANVDRTVAAGDDDRARGIRIVADDSFQIVPPFPATIVGLDRKVEMDSAVRRVTVEAELAVGCQRQPDPSVGRLESLLGIGQRTAKLVRGLDYVMGFRLLLTGITSFSTNSSS